MTSQGLQPRKSSSGTQSLDYTASQRREGVYCERYTLRLVRGMSVLDIWVPETTNLWETDSCTVIACDALERNKPALEGNWTCQSSTKEGCR